MALKSKRFRTWAEFKTEFEAFLPMRNATDDRPIFSNYIFRGQMEASWGLTSSFDRSVPDQVANRDIEYQKWQRFYVSLQSRLGHTLASHPIEVAALAQHYGTPTRLLDFSLSPYIAAFFAFFDALRFHRHHTADVAVWCLHVSTFQKNCGGKFEIASARNLANQRIRNQLGKFLVNRSDFDSLETYIETENPSLGDSVTKLNIPVSEARAAINDLLLMGISPVDLYPDHEGIAMYIKLRQLLEGYKFGS